MFLTEVQLGSDDEAVLIEAPPYNWLEVAKQATEQLNFHASDIIVFDVDINPQC